MPEKNLSAYVPVEIDGLVFETIVLPNSKGNQTLFRMDFQHKAMLLLRSIAKKACYFSDKPRKTYPFLNEYGTRASVPVAKVGVNPCALHVDGYKGLKPEQRYNVLIRRFKNYFKTGGEATLYAKSRSPIQEDYKTKICIYIANIPYDFK